MVTSSTVNQFYNNIALPISKDLKLFMTAISVDTKATCLTLKVENGEQNCKRISKIFDTCCLTLVLCVQPVEMVYQVELKQM